MTRKSISGVRAPDNKINILPPEVYNLLSAGEVVENPASVVKELAENSIDAGATKISIEITNGGIDEIVITDNGAGCGESEMPKVFLPHATSKIEKTTDIDNILSLGFRGEAMASISAVSRVEFTSKPKDQNYAVQMTNDNKTVHTATNDGTKVKVANLFYNTPARRKFLKSENTEKNLITGVVHNIIFSHPNLNIKYSADGETQIDFRGQGLLSAIGQIYGTGDEMLPIDFQNEKIEIGGYISNIKLSKKNKSRQIVLVNGRVIDGGIVANAVNETMSNFLMVGEYPVFVLNIEIDTGIIDVNVHPQKREIRFDDGAFIVNSIEMAITKTLDNYFFKQQQATTTQGQPSQTAQPQQSAQPSQTAQLPETAQLPQTQATGIPPHTQPQNDAPTNRPKFTGKSFDPNAVSHTSEQVFLRAMSFIANDTAVTHVAGGRSVLGEFMTATPIQNRFEPPPQTEQTAMVNTDEYRVLGQVFETYLIVSTADRLLIIDQHAMAERINYDNFKRGIDTNNIVAQTLLSPEIIRMSPKEQVAFEKIKPHLTAMGFDCDDFGGDSIRVIAIPLAISPYGIDEFLRAILCDRELQTDKLSDILKDRIAMAACKASIRAGDILTDEQITAFLQNYQKSNIIPLCPHGRPILVAYTKSKIENLFGRK